MKLRNFIVSFFVFSSAAIAKDEVKNITVKIELNSESSEIKFDTASIEAPFGKTIRLTYRNNAPAGSEILHNVAIVALGKDKELLSSLKLTNYEIDKVDPALILAQTKVLNPGESDTIVFKPAAIGKYMYVCLMPGHGEMLGMKGYLNISNKMIKKNKLNSKNKTQSQEVKK